LRTWLSLSECRPDEFLATYTEETPGRTIQLIAGEVVVNQPTAAEAAEFDVSLELERDRRSAPRCCPASR